MDMVDERQPRLRGIDHFALFVADIDRSATWYVDTLGFVRDPQRDDSLLHLRHPGGLDIVLRRRHTEGSTKGIGLDHFAIRVSDLDELQSWSNKLVSSGNAAEIHEGRTGWTIDLRDPDDFEIELFVPKASRSASTAA